MRKLKRPLGFTGWRWDLLTHVQGATLEIGCGWGNNFDHYSAAATVTAFDLEPVRLRTARTKPVSISLTQTDAQVLPYPAQSFDSVVGTLVFCSIPQPHLALQEIRRVLKPHGKLFLIDHVRTAHTWLGATQDTLNPLWHKVTGGCNLNRDNELMVKQAGFNLQQVRTGWYGVLKLLVASL